jgi:hypothetical protein
VKGAVSDCRSFIEQFELRLIDAETIKTLSQYAHLRGVTLGVAQEFVNVPLDGVR